MAGKTKKWWKRWEWLGSLALDILAFSPEILTAVAETGLVPEYTFIGQAAKLALPISLVLKALGLRERTKEKKQENKLPSGLAGRIAFDIGEKADVAVNKLKQGANYASKIRPLRKKRDEETR